MKKNRVKVFIIHRWNMSDLQAKIRDMLKSDRQIEFVDSSYTRSNPAEKDEFIQDYACAMMMDSDIVIVLPDSEEQHYGGGIDDDYLSDLSHNFGYQRGLEHDVVYVTELKTLMFDACENVPVLVLGWTKENAEYLANILKNPKGIGGRHYDADRFFFMGLNEISDESDLSNKIMKIIEKRQDK